MDERKFDLNDDELDQVAGGNGAGTHLQHIPPEAGGMQTMELNDDALDQVSGGLEMQTVGDKRIETCDEFICVWCDCGKVAGQKGHYCEPQGGLLYPDISWIEYTCTDCAKKNTCRWAFYQLGTSPQ